MISTRLKKAYLDLEEIAHTKTVAELVAYYDKTERGVKNALSYRKLCCLDYPKKKKQQIQIYKTGNKPGAIILPEPSSIILSDPGPKKSINLKPKVTSLTTEQIEVLYPNALQDYDNYKDFLLSHSCLVDGLIQGQKSKTIQYSIVRLSNEHPDSLHFCYFTIDDIVEKNSVIESLISFGKDPDKIIELFTDKTLSEKDHLANIKKGCIYIANYNAARLKSKNIMNYRLALRDFHDLSSENKAVLVLDDLYDALIDKDLSAITEEDIKRLINSRAARDSALSDFEEYFKHVTKIAGTWTSLIGAEIPDTYMFVNPPDKYTHDDINFLEAKKSNDYYVPQVEKHTSVYTTSRKGRRPSIFQDSTVMNWWKKEGYNREFVFGAAIGVSETLSTWETAYGTSADCHNLISEITGPKVGVLVVAGTSYDEDNRILIKDNGSETDSNYYNVSFDGDVFKCEELSVANHKDAIQQMKERYDGRVIVFNQKNLWKQAKTICSSDGKCVMIAFYSPRLPQFSDGIVQFVERLKGTFNTHPSRWLITDRDEHIKYTTALGDINAMRDVIQYHFETKDTDKVKQKFKTSQEYYNYLLIHNLTLSSNKPARREHRFGNRLTKNDYFEALSVDAFKKSEYKDIPIQSIYVALTNYFDEPLDGEKIDIKVILNEDIWEDHLEEKKRIEKIIQKRDENDSYRNITKYHSNYKDKDPRYMSDDAFNRIMVDFSQGYAVIIALKHSQNDIISDCTGVLVQHSIDGSLKLFRENKQDQTYAVKVKE
jgi:predicted DNA-binding ribbon-helix-helix protein